MKMAPRRDASTLGTLQRAAVLKMVILVLILMLAVILIVIIVVVVMIIAAVMRKLPIGASTAR